MPRNWLALLVAFALLSANLLSIDFDGEAFEGKGIDTAVLYFPSAVQKEAAASAKQSKPAVTSITYAPIGEGTQVFAFEVPFTLLAKYLVPLPHITAPLPVIFRFAAPVLSEPLICATPPRDPPPRPVILRFCLLRAPPLFPLFPLA